MVKINKIKIKRLRVRILLLLVLLLICSTASYSSSEMEPIMGINFKHEDNSFSINRIDLYNSYRTDTQERGDYLLEVVNGDDDLIDSAYFDLPDLSYSADPDWFDDDGNQIFVPNVSSVEMFIQLRYTSDARRILIRQTIDEQIIFDDSIEKYIITNKLSAPLPSAIEQEEDVSSTRNTSEVINDNITQNQDVINDLEDVNYNVSGGEVDSDENESYLLHIIIVLITLLVTVILLIVLKYKNKQ